MKSDGANNMAGFSLSLRREKENVFLDAAEETGRQVTLRVSLTSFFSWGILFRDFLRFLYWFPHFPFLTQTISDFFQEPFSFAELDGPVTLFRIEPNQKETLILAELLVWQPSRLEEPALSIQEGAALPFLNLIALGLLQKNQGDFLVSLGDLEKEQLFVYHGELRRIEDQFRATGFSPIWITPPLERILMVSRAVDSEISYPESVPAPLLQAAEEKVMRRWAKEETEAFIQFLSEMQAEWHQRYRKSQKNSVEAALSLQNWIFSLNLLGFFDRYLDGSLPTRMPNPIAPFLGFLLEHFFIAQWESDLWPVRRSGLEEMYRQLIAFLLRH